MMKLRSLALLISALLLTTSCGSGGGGGGGGEAEEPGLFAVRTIDPISGTSSLPNDVALTIHLNAPVDPATAGSDSFKVNRRGSLQVHPGIYQVSQDGLRVTFRPEPWYDVSTSYEVEVTRSLHSRTGEELARSFVSSFSTGPWPSPRAVTQSEFRLVSERMNMGRSSHTSTLLPTGSVLLAGGFRDANGVTNSAEVFLPTSESFVPVQLMKQGRANHTAGKLPTGLVLIAGGENSAGDALASCELFNFGDGSFIQTTPMNFARNVHTGTVLPDGRVLVTGGLPLETAGATAELYDPTSHTWSRTDNDMAEARWGHRATLLADGPLAGKVLITGGYWTYENPLKTVEIFDPGTNRFRTLAGKLSYSRWRHSAVELPGGLVLVSDGGEQTGEIFNPTTELFTPTTNGDSEERYQAATFPFRTGEVLCVGGFSYKNGILFLHASVEQYIHNYGPTGKYFSRPLSIDGGVTLYDNRAYSAWTEFAPGRFLISGGLGSSEYDPDLNTATIFEPIQ